MTTPTTVAEMSVVASGGTAAMLTGGVAGGLSGAMMNRGMEKESAGVIGQAVADVRIVVAVELATRSAERSKIVSCVIHEIGSPSILLPEG